MVNFEKYIIVYDGDERQSTILIQLLKSFNIDTNNWAFNSRSQRYWIERGIVHASKQGHPVREPITISKLVELIFREYPWLENLYWFRHLKADDVITIHFPSNNDNEFPFGVSSEMWELEGKQYVINEIIPHEIAYGSEFARRKFFNGDYCRYSLKGSGWSWHSSMFEPIGTTPVKTVDLTSISILPEVINIEPNLKFSPRTKVKIAPEAGIQFVDPVDLPW